jgi:inorganic phosphate transporter, PiT family
LNHALTPQQTTDFIAVSHQTVETIQTYVDPSAITGDPHNDVRNYVSTREFTPTWVKVAVAMALGLGIMVGWKRIVVTVGERIGKQDLTYAQGAAAEITAMATIWSADHRGLPVSTTHVLSSGVGGTMAANHSGLQWNTVRSLAMAGC